MFSTVSFSLEERPPARCLLYLNLSMAGLNQSRSGKSSQCSYNRIPGRGSRQKLRQSALWSRRAPAVHICSPQSVLLERSRHYLEPCADLHRVLSKSNKQYMLQFRIFCLAKKYLLIIEGRQCSKPALSSKNCSNERHFIISYFLQHHNI